MKAKTCDAPMRTVTLHESVRVGICIERCTRKPLPTMVVCEYHADPAAVRMAMDAMARRVRL